MYVQKPRQALCSRPETYFTFKLISPEQSKQSEEKLVLKKIQLLIGALSLQSFAAPVK